jgi:hypothetical protein
MTNLVKIMVDEMFKKLYDKLNNLDWDILPLLIDKEFIPEIAVVRALIRSCVKEDLQRTINTLEHFTWGRPVHEIVLNVNI